MHNNILALFIDMDGTLIDTDTANTYAYNYAVQEVIGINMMHDLSLSERITTKDVQNAFPFLHKSIFQEIKKLKDKKYREYLFLTQRNQKIIDAISANPDKIIVLVSKANHNRVMTTLAHHDLLDYFDYFFCSQHQVKGKDYNKYEDALTGLHLAPQNVFVYENEEQEIKNALDVNIPSENIIKIGE